MVVESQNKEIEGTTVEGQTTEVEPVENQQDVSPEDVGDEEVKEPEAYKPNTKFNVRNEEHHFDEWIVPLIKDEETEKKIRELYEKSRGIDYVKRDRQALKETSSNLKREIEETYKPVVQQQQAMNHFLQNGDLGSYFHYSGLKPQDVLKWAINYAQLPPEQRMNMDQTAMNNINAVHQNFQQMSQSEHMAQQLVEYRHKEVDWMITSRPEVQSVQSAYDQRNGPGSFKQEVINRGIMLSQTTGQDVPADQVVMQVVNLLSGYAQPQMQQMPQQQMQSNPQGMGNNIQQQVQPQNPAAKPVIPNIQGRGTSPAKKMIRSLDDMRKRAEEFNG